MTKIKTAKEFLEENRKLKEKYEYQILLAIDSRKDTSVLIKEMEEKTSIELIMKDYAEQFIDLAAEKATTIDEEGSFFRKGEYKTIVDKNSILYIKKELK